MRVRRLTLVVALGVIAALIALGLVGTRVLERDRGALYADYAAGELAELETASRGFSADLAEIGKDLDLAVALIDKAESPRVVERDLRAIATIKREYYAMDARAHGETLGVDAFDSPPGITALVTQPLTHMLDVADTTPDKVRVSPPLGPGPAAWYRVFARRPKGDGPTVAVVVDLSIMLERSKLARGADAKLYVASADGTVAPISNLTSIADPALRALAESARAGMATTTIVPAELARSLGLPDTTAVAFSAPLVVDEGAPWTLLAVTSTSALENQEKTLVRRVTVGGALVLVLLLSAAAYVVYNTRRTATLEERLRHVQEQRRFEERMVHSEKLATAGQLAAGIAHEIGTPLNVARGRVELVLSHLGAQHAEAKNHEIVIDQIDRVTRLIQQLLDYVRPRGAVTQQLELGAAMRTVAELLGPQATKRGVTLVVEADKPVAIEADPDQIQQVLVNLVLNALDACEKGGAVTMRAHEREIEVIDNGAGIPRELQAQIFDPFFTTKKRGQGTGLGLWVVAQLVHAQHGEIDLDSAPGKGTTVRVRWPA